jgi:hypothetical protein
MWWGAHLPCLARVLRLVQSDAGIRFAQKNMQETDSSDTSGSRVSGTCQLTRCTWEHGCCEKLLFRVSQLCRHLGRGRRRLLGARWAESGSQYAVVISSADCARYACQEGEGAGWRHGDGRQGAAAACCVHAAAARAGQAGHTLRAGTSITLSVCVACIRCAKLISCACHKGIGRRWCGIWGDGVAC